MRNNDSITKQIEKLLALAYNNSNKKESESAFRKAYELMIKYNFSKDRQYGLEKGRDIKQFLPSPPTVNKTWKEKFADFIKVIKIETISFDKLFRKVSADMVTLQVIPDCTVQSGRAVESILNTFHSMYEGFMDRIWNDGMCIVFKVADHATFRVLYEHNQISFYFVVPKTHVRTVRNSISQVWAKCAINEVSADYLQKLKPNKTICAYLELKHHFFKSTLVDRNKHAPVESLVSAGRNVIDDDIAILDVMMIPLSDKWKVRAKKARNDYGKGNERKTTPTKLSDIAFVILDFVVDGMINKVLSFLDVAIGAEPEKDDIDRTILNHRLKSSTEQKWTHSGFETVIRIASTSENRSRANQTLTTIGTAFKDISGDNEFEIKHVASDGRLIKSTTRFIQQLQKNTPPLLRINGNILSTPEMSQILQLPSGTLQQEYPEIVSIKTKETTIDERVRKGGLLLGEAIYKTEKVKVYHPVKDWDEICLTDVSIGGQGQGKTKGYLSNRLVETYLNGFGGVAIDPAKREIGDQIQAIVDAGIIPKEDFVRYDFGKFRMRLDWVEATRHEKGKTRLASTILDFFAVQEDTSGQTGRFLRAGALALKTGKITELFDIFEDEERLDEAIAEMREVSLAKKTLQQYKTFSPERRRQVIVPIYNRLDDILGDEILTECLESDITLDFIDIMSQRKIVVFDLPDDDIFGITKDILIDLIDSKIDIAARLRKKVYGEKAEFPFFYIMDEPHKYLRASKRWTKSVVEMRKWRIGITWAFHYWEQVPKELQKAIKNALPHYHIYPTSTDTWKAMAEVISPFTVEDGLKLQRWHSINLIRSGGENVKPFIAKMALPPAERFKRKSESTG